MRPTFVGRTVAPHASRNVVATLGAGCRKSVAVGGSNLSAEEGRMRIPSPLGQPSPCWNLVNQNSLLVELSCGQMEAGCLSRSRSSVQSR